MGIIIGVLLPTLLSVNIGILILQKSSYFRSLNENANVSFGYFLGLSINIVLIRIIDAVATNFVISLYLVTALEVTYIILNFKLLKYFFNKFSVLNYLKIVSAICFVYFLLFFFWTRDLSQPNEPIGTFGTLHSYRYAWLSNVMVECNIVPTVGQNTGQSMLAAISSVVSNSQQPYFYLGAWLSLSIVMFFLLTKNILILFGLNQKTSDFASVLFMFLGCSLSFKYVSVVDSGYPLLLNGYTDIILGTAIFLLVCYILTTILENKSNNFDKFIMFSFFSCSYFVAPQNILILCLFFTVTLLLPRRISFRKFFAIRTTATIFAIASALSIPLGGFFAPSILQSQIKIPNVEPVNKLTIDFLPGYPFVVTTNKQSVQQGEHLIMQLLENLQKTNSEPQVKLWAIIDFMVSNVLAVALPLLGFVIIFAVRNNVKVFEQKSTAIHISKMLILRILGFLIIIQALIPLLLRISGYKWELTRFALPFFVVGNLLFSVLTIRSIYNNSAKKMLYIITASVALIGPLTYLGSTIFVNSSNFREVYEHKIYFGSGPEVNGSICRVLLNASG